MSEKAEEMRMAAAELSEELEALADDLDQHVKNVNVASAVGSGTAALGGVVAVAAGIASFFTFGATIPIAIAAGATAATAGGLTAGGSQLAKLIISKLKMKDAEEKWEEFQEKYKTVAEIEDVEIKAEGSAEDVVNKLMEGPQTANQIADWAKDAKPIASKFGGAISKQMGKAAAGMLGKVAAKSVPFLNAVLLPFSVRDLVEAVTKLQKGEKSQAGDVLRKIAKVLEDLANDEDEEEEEEEEEAGMRSRDAPLMEPTRLRKMDLNLPTDHGDQEPQISSFRIVTPPQPKAMDATTYRRREMKKRTVEKMKTRREKERTKRDRVVKASVYFGTAAVIGGILVAMATVFHKYYWI